MSVRVWECRPVGQGDSPESLSRCLLDDGSLGAWTEVVFELALLLLQYFVAKNTRAGRTLPTYTNQWVASQHDGVAGGTESGPASARRGSVSAWQALYTRVSLNYCRAHRQSLRETSTTMNICQIITMSKILTFVQLLSSADVEGRGAASPQKTEYAATRRGRLLWRIRWRKG